MTEQKNERCCDKTLTEMTLDRNANYLVTIDSPFICFVSFRFVLSFAFGLVWFVMQLVYKFGSLSIPFRCTHRYIHLCRASFWADSLANILCTPWISTVDVLFRLSCAPFVSFRFKQTELILTENDEQTKNDGSQLKLSAKTEMRWKGNGIDKMVFWLNQIHLSNTNKNS